MMSQSIIDNKTNKISTKITKQTVENTALLNLPWNNKRYKKIKYKSNGQKNGQKISN